MRRLIITAPIFVLTIVCLHATAHDEHHNQQNFQKTKEAIEQSRQINVEYLTSIKPIFRKSCFDCHSSTTHYPWYNALPGIRQLIASDIEEAKKHMDMTGDFPFPGHGTMAEDLEAIRKAIEKGDMPPFRYWILHKNTKLTESEKKQVLGWANRGLQLLK
jgi:hypothetical protein